MQSCPLTFDVPPCLQMRAAGLVVEQRQLPIGDVAWVARSRWVNGWAGGDSCSCCSCCRICGAVRCVGAAAPLPVLVPLSHLERAAEHAPLSFALPLCYLSPCRRDPRQEYVLDYILERKSCDDLLSSIKSDKKGGSRYERQKVG